MTQMFSLESRRKHHLLSYRKLKTNPGPPRPEKFNTEEDLVLKAEAFEKDFKLPLNGAEVHITSLRGGVDVASGYERVVPDGEGLWLELSEEQIYKLNFSKRQKTATRQ